MASESQSDAAHRQYSVDGLCARILMKLREQGKDVENLTRDDIATFDEFHVGGRDETRELARLAGIGPQMRVLDIGSGVGGPARTLSQEFGCRVVGIDATAEYCEAARMLTKLVGLGDRIEFVHGSAPGLPFPEESFDVVWLQFVGMNIQDKSRLIGEIHRVLQGGGRFVLHEVMEGNGEDLDYPVFWANEASYSFLAKPLEISRKFREAGFDEMFLEDVTEQSCLWSRIVLDRSQKPGAPALGLGVIVPDNTRAKAINFARNMELRRVTVYRGMFEKA